MLYSEKVMDHFTHPRNVGEIPDADGVGEVGNAVCGDIMKMYLKVKDGIIVDAKFKTFGCGSAIATSSMATEMIKGHSIDEALTLTNKAVVEALGGLPPAKIHCSVLAEEAVKAAIADYYKGHINRNKPCINQSPLYSLTIRSNVVARLVGKSRECITYRSGWCNARTNVLYATCRNLRLCGIVQCKRISIKQFSLSLIISYFKCERAICYNIAYG